MQPISTASHTATSAAASLAAIGVAPRRRGGVINYAEGASDDEFGVDSEEDEEFSGRGSSKRSTPRLGTASFRVGSPSGGIPHREKQELDKTYLGLMPPSRYISSKSAFKTRHDYP
jgi:chromatin structure-remodeling complex subunit SFH1